MLNITRHAGEGMRLAISHEDLVELAMQGEPLTMDVVITRTTPTRSFVSFRIPPQVEVLRHELLDEEDGHATGAA